MSTIPRRPPSKNTMSAGSAATALVVLLPIHAIVSGLLVRYLYHRLFAPTFTSLPQHIGIAQALGVAIFIGFLTQDESSIGNDERSLAEKEVMWVFVRVMTVLMALIVGWFMP